VEGLLPFTNYSSYVTEWAGPIESSPSACAVVETLPGTAFPVTLEESGLPANDVWYVSILPGPTLDGPGGGGSLVAELTNGSFTLSVTTHDPRFAVTFPHRFVVDGGPVTLLVEFSPWTFPVLFSEVGLPPGVGWSVTLGASFERSDGTLLAFNVTNGTYAYSIGDVAGWHQSTLGYSGSVSVSGAPVLELPLGFHAVTYPVVFSESGLPNGTSWGVVVDGMGRGSTGSSIAVDLPNGSFTYRVNAPSGWSPSRPEGTLTVTAGNATEQVAFVRSPSVDLPGALVLATSAVVGGWIAMAAVLVGRQKSPPFSGRVP
ncbi:MAG TPA: hypothetical protein VEG42_05050, partial [Thermoplasmata archaeon]|nr:hypothetical protein [Thermoplasmata archaeon]